MNKLDKNLGVVVYTLQREKEAIKLHLQSSNFALAQDDRQLQLHDRRKEIWDIILEQAHQMFEDIDMPKELVECLLQLVPHMPVRLNHMYVMWKITAGKTRPIVPSYASPTALAARWVHEQLFPYTKAIPTVCLDSLTYTEELHRLERSVPHGADFIIVELDVVALYPSIPIGPAIEAVRRFMEEDTTIKPEARNLILGVLEWVMNNNYIEFDGMIYRQVDGIVMGSALSIVVANIFMYKAVEEQVLRAWVDKLLSYKRYMDDISAFLLGSEEDAHRLKEELEAQCPHIKFTMQCHRSRANFLDLAIEVERNEGMHMTDISYRIYRKPGNSMAYLQARSFHPNHTSMGMIKGEFLRYLTKSSKYEFYLEDIRMLINAFINRGVRQEVVVNIAKKIPWASREYYRQRALGSKTRDIPGGGAIFTTTIDPAVQAALKAGLHVDLTRVRATPTAGAEEEVQQALGRNLSAVFPSKGAIALKSCAKLRALLQAKK